jgi:predicted transport protein
VCGIPTNSLNKTFANFTKVLKKDRYLESIQAHFLLLPSYRRFPNDEEFKRDLKTKDLYNFRSRSYWLRRLENHDRKERVFIDEYSIEHIMPQNDNLSSAWKIALGSEWRQVQQNYLHTIGNLTLTAYNSKYSDKTFPEKRDMEKGFQESPLKLNQGLGKIENWDEEAICERAERLSKMALDVWKAPKLEPDVLECYKSKPTQSGYTIADHPYLQTGKLAEVFKAFSKEVLALDPCVTEEFLKLYVAYKAESNFVDVVPQAKRLRLSLNMRFSEINDPKGICKDVSGIGRWGNGDVELGLASLDDLPYVMSLVRQSLERQMEV